MCATLQRGRGGALNIPILFHLFWRGLSERLYKLVFLMGEITATKRMLSQGAFFIFKRIGSKIASAGWGRGAYYACVTQGICSI